MSNIESDEAFARQLQAQEMGIRAPPDIQTPLMIDHNRNPTVINARLSDVHTARISMGIIVAYNTPQILATLIVLSMYWNDSRVCDDDHRARWKYWALLSAIRMLIYTLILVFIHTYHQWLEDRPMQMMRATNIRNIVDAIGIIWFVIGNMWLFGDDGMCENPIQSPVYQLCIAMLTLSYLQICLPCIIAVLMIPVFCFCMPTLIRFLARLQDIGAAKGATDAAIDSLPLISITPATFTTNLNSAQDATCPICLSEMAVGDEARMLLCKHIFHRKCVDEWLRVNASCPTCRNSIFVDTTTSTTNPPTTAIIGGGGVGNINSSINTNEEENKSNESSTSTIGSATSITSEETDPSNTTATTALRNNRTSTGRSNRSLFGFQASSSTSR